MLSSRPPAPCRTQATIHVLAAEAAHFSTGWKRCGLDAVIQFGPAEAPTRHVITIPQGRSLATKRFSSKQFFNGVWALSWGLAVPCDSDLEPC